VVDIDALRIDKDGKRATKEPVTEEIPLTLYLNNKELLTLLCSPADLKELSIGFLYSSGLIRTLQDIERVIVDTRNWASYVELKEKNDPSPLMFKRLYTSGCGRGTLFYNALDHMNREKITSSFRVNWRKLLEMVDSFQKKSLIFKKTGGIHSAALSDGENIIVFKEDIGRHNAVDKVAGEALMKGIAMGNSIVLTSGRISSEIVFKTQKMGSPILISRSAPTDQAQKLAEACDMTLVGFARGQRMNVYAGRHRIG